MGGPEPLDEDHQEHGLWIGRSALGDAGPVSDFLGTKTWHLDARLA